MLARRTFHIGQATVLCSRAVRWPTSIRTVEVNELVSSVPLYEGEVVELKRGRRECLALSL